MKIASKKIGDNQPVFIVAELGINHNGKIGFAKKMIKEARKAGADAIKIQSFITEDFVGNKKLTYTYRSQGKAVTESQYQMFKRNELSRKEQKELFDYAKRIGIIIFSTPQDNSFKTVDYLCKKEFNIPAIKVGSDDLTNLPMMDYYARKNKPMIISTGMSTLREVKDAVKTIQKTGNKRIAILKCTSLYPTPPEEANLGQIKTLQDTFKDCVIGFSDHTGSSTAAVAATILGAKIIEKHFTLNKDLPGPDHWFAADPEELTLLVKQVREAEKILGRTELSLSQKECEMKNIARRSIIFARDIKKSQRIKSDDLELKRPGIGLPPKYLPKVIGKIAKRSFKKGHIVKLSNIK